MHCTHSSGQALLALGVRPRSDRCNRTAQTGCSHTAGTCPSQPGIWKSETKRLTGPVSGDNPPPDSQTAVLQLCPRMVGGTKELCRPFPKGPEPTHEGSVLMSYHLPRPPPPYPITVGVRISSPSGGREHSVRSSTLVIITTAPSQTVSAPLYS